MTNNHKILFKQKLASALGDVALTVPHREQMSKILSAALSSADPELAVLKNLRLIENELVAGLDCYRLSKKTRIITIALGKAAPAMLQGAIEQLGDRYMGGVCVCKHLEEEYTRAPLTEYILSDHPVPGEGSLRAGEAIRKAVTGLGKDDLVLLLVSGGGSSLAALPVENVTLVDLQQLTNTLLRSGATIAELNTVRKHLDRLKGGGLVRLAAPAKVVALVLSDVVGNNLEVIASGPAYPDPSTFADAMRIIEKASINGKIPASVRNHLQLGCEGRIPETLKGDEPDAQRCFNTIISSNAEACAAAAAQAHSMGFHAEIINTELVGEARLAARDVISQARQRSDFRRPFMLVWGGETTVSVSGSGKGGRNQELALASVREIAGFADTLLVTLATDGEDGPTDAAGALVNGDTLSRALALNLKPDDYLRNNDAYTFFAALGDLLRLGPTGTNVNDLTFVFGF